VDDHRCPEDTIERQTLTRDGFGHRLDQIERALLHHAPDHGPAWLRLGTLLAQFELANPSGELLPGDYAQVSLPVDSNAHVVNVPATALIFRAAGPQLAVLGADNRIQLRDVHIGLDMGDILQIDRGVTSKDRIVDHPPDSIMAGDKVTVAAAAAPKAEG